MAISFNMKYCPGQSELHDQEESRSNIPKLDKSVSRTSKKAFTPGTVCNDQGGQDLYEAEDLRYTAAALLKYFEKLKKNRPRSLDPDKEYCGD